MNQGYIPGLRTMPMFDTKLGGSSLTQKGNQDVAYFLLSKNGHLKAFKVKPITTSGRK